MSGDDLRASDQGHWTRLAEQDVVYHSRQFREPYRSTVHLAKFIQSHVNNGGGSALDVGCGAGANIYHLNPLLPGYRWTGVDLAGAALFPIGRPHLERARVDARLLQGDFHQLGSLLPGERFDLVLLIHALMVTPEADRLLEEALAMTKGWLFINSLVTDFSVDAQIAVTDYTWPPDRQGPLFYNIWSLQRLRSFCKKRGCRELVAQDFEIDLDLEVPPAGAGMGTYTRRLVDGHRLQFSGPLLLPWKLVGVRMGES